jgi:hypothetical protein
MLPYISSESFTAFKEYGQARRFDVCKAYTKGQGPLIKPSKLVGSNGQFLPGMNSQVLEINKNILRDFEKGKLGSKALLHSTIAHELTHFFDDQDGVDYPGEEGQLYEEAVYGLDIDNLNDGAVFEKNGCKARALDPFK